MPDDLETAQRRPEAASARTDEPAGFERFLRLYYRGTPGEELVGRPPEMLRAAALAHLRIGLRRGSGETKLRVYTPTAGDGWRALRTVIDIVTDDMPFLLDSTLAALSQLGATAREVVHPIIAVRRTEAGQWLGPADSDPTGDRVLPESFIHIEVDERRDPAHRQEIEQRLRTVLADVRAAVEDWELMRARLQGASEYLATAGTPVPEAERDEAAAFLYWLADDNFTLLGYREYRITPDSDGLELAIVPGTGLGILRNPERRMLRDSGAPARLPPEIAALVQKPEPLIVTKSSSRSPVHRPVHMDHIGVKVFGPDGRVTGERRFVGLFTSSAYHRSARQIPLVRRNVRQVLERAAFPPDSHDGKALLNILEHFPRDELFERDSRDLYETAMGILRLETRPSVRLFFRRDPFGRFFTVLAFVPRERFNTALRVRIGGVLDEAFGGPNSVISTEMGESSLARVHFFVPTDSDRTQKVDLAAVQRAAVRAARTWDDDLADALLSLDGEEHGKALLRRYGFGFSAGYREDFTSEDAVADIGRVERLSDADPLQVHLGRAPNDGPAAARLRLYRQGPPVPLSDCLPILENLGFRVLEERPYTILRAEAPEVSLHDFLLQEPTGKDVDVAAIVDLFADAFIRIWRGEVENDGFNRLVAAGALGWRDIVILRAIAKYLRQAGMAFSQAYVEDTLLAFPLIARNLAALFRSRFDPDLPEEQRTHDGSEIVTSIEQALDTVSSLDQDRILRRYLNVVGAMLRTNFFQSAEDGGLQSTLSFKLDSRRVDELPAPRPLYEIFVYSPRLEAIHLRGGKVARGGIRWSDRREDFRSEILALMKAQQVKNAVIVPAGAKGGFMPKRLPPAESRDAFQAEGIACYRLFIDALLDLTDNLVRGAIVPPDRVVRYDEDDPYLVVAADKGTATFSDMANAIAREHGFWLDDAFASGGSAGYDHKAMGITARGAWESVKRHFYEIGTDIQSTPFTVVGVGDMSGDVFGNGMLQSRCIRLVAAFDHRHVFLDPNPDPVASYAERERLFRLPRSSWADYDTKLISPGGGVFPRTLKSIPLSPQAQALTGLGQAQVTPAELIRALLTAEVDLLWFGGIGTYVKSSDESQADAGDRSNEPLRVDGRAIKAKVIGEGANLASTQRGRVEYALHGGRLNTDSIDNSAGVDCSDHEVNLKIALRQPIESGTLTLEERDTLLRAMTEEVAHLVLTDNVLQSRAISLEQQSAVADREWLAAMMRGLAREGRLDRAVEFLPDEEVLRQRAANRLSLTRPELAILLSYAKLSLNDALCAGSLPAHPAFEPDLEAYFPQPVQQRFPEAIAHHRLRNNIVATVLANEIVNRGGIVFASRLREETGAGPGDVARGFAVVRNAFAMPALWEGADALDGMIPAAPALAVHCVLRQFLYRQTLWALRNLREPIDLPDAMARYAEPISQLLQNVRDLLPAKAREALEARQSELEQSGLPPGIAFRLAALQPLDSAFDIVQVAEATRRDVSNTARAYFTLGAELGVDRLKAGVSRMEPKDHWERRALQAMVEDLYAAQRTLTQQAIGGQGERTACEALDRWLTREKENLSRTQRALADLQGGSAIDLPKLTLAGRLLRGLAQS